MKDFKWIIAFLVGISMAIAYPILADTTLVRGRAYNFGDTPPTWALGDVQPIGSDGVIVEQQDTSSIDDFIFHIAADMTYINANITGGGQTTANPVSGDGTVGDAITVVADAIDATHLDWGTGADQISSEDIPVPETGTPTYDDVQDMFNTTQASGKISGGGFTLGADGSINVLAGTGMIRANNSELDEVSFFDWSEASSVVLTDVRTNYIYVNNAGTVGATVTKSDVDGRTEILLGKVFRDGTDLHEVEAGMILTESTKRVIQYITSVFGEVVRASGVVVGESGNRYITTTNGVLFAGLTVLTTTGIDTTGADTFETYYRDGGAGWTEGTASQIDNLYWDDDSGVLNTLTANRYGVHWAYGDPDGHVMIVYGQGDYTLLLAEAANPPSTLPEHIQDFGFIAAKIIAKQGVATLYSIESAYDTMFTAAGAVDHNELSNLQGGTATEYYHMTSAQHGAITGGAASDADTYHTHDTLVPYTGASGAVDLGAQAFSTTGLMTFTNWDIAGSTPTVNYLPYVIGISGDTATVGWLDPATALVAPGSDTYVAYNNGGVLGAEAGMVYNDTDDVLTLQGAIVSNAGGNNSDTLLGSGNHADALRVDAATDQIEVNCGILQVGTTDTSGTLALFDGSANRITIDVPAIGANWALTLPINDGAIGDFLQTDGNGNTVWTVPTDTDKEVLCWTALDGTLITQVAPTVIVCPQTVPTTGLATYTTVYINDWTDDFGNTDTITITLYVDGVAKDTWTTDAGAAGSYGGAVSETLTRDQTVEIRVQTTTVVTGVDTITIQSANCEVTIV